LPFFGPAHGVDEPGCAAFLNATLRLRDETTERNCDTGLTKSVYCYVFTSYKLNTANAKAYFHYL
jgi:hypothetical protein